MRILHVCQPTDGGTAVVVRQLVEAGAAAGDEVVVACPAEGPLAGWTTAAGGTWHPLPMARRPGPNDLLLVWRLLRLTPTFDVVHAHSSKGGALVRTAAAVLGRRRPRVVFTPHGWSWYVGGRGAAVYRWFERQAARRTDVITVVSRAELEDGRRVLGAAAGLRLIENGVDTDAFSPLGPVATRSSGPLLVQIGRLSVQKAQDRSVRVLARLTDRTTALRLVGSGPAEDELKALASELGVEERVEFVGTADPRPHLRACDVVLLPSRWEGMSLALLEAMATGAAIITSDCGGSDALGDAGVVVSNDDDDVVRQMTGHLDRMIADRHERQALGVAARERAERHFGLARVLDRYAEVWDSPRVPDRLRAAG